MNKIIERLKLYVCTDLSSGDRAKLYFEAQRLINCVSREDAKAMKGVAPRLFEGFFLDMKANPSTAVRRDLRNLIALATEIASKNKKQS